MSPPEPGTVVIFLHIPKAGGLTLYDILDREYGRAHIYTFVGGRQRLQHSIHQFQALPAARQAQLQLLRGHVLFGVHQWLPQRPFTYITMLRDPVARVISHYHYVRGNPQHLLHEQVVGEQMDLERYVSSGINYELDNGQTRQIAGVGAEVPFGRCSQDLLVQAVANLERHFAVVGLTERFDETLLVLKRDLGWRLPPVYTRQNVSRQPAGRTPLPDATREMIAAHNQLDLELYAYAQTQFAKRWKQIPAKELSHFRQRNARYAPLGRVKTAVRQLLRRLKEAT